MLNNGQMKKYDNFDIDLLMLTIKPDNLMKNLQLLILLLICCIPDAYTQTIEHEKLKFDLLTSENKVLQKGLSQNTIYCLLQDTQGYMWFGTWDGLNKYDGYKFTIYNTLNGLSNETINTLLEADDGKIWIGTENGLNCIDRSTGLISMFYHNPDDTTTLSSNWINYLYQDMPGRIMVCTPAGLNLMDTKTGKVKQYKSRLAGLRNIPSNNINYISRDRKNNYWVGTDFGVVRYVTETNENTRFLSRPGDLSSLSGNSVTCIFEDSDNNIWIGTKQGLNLFNESEGTFIRFVYNPDDPSTISHNRITRIFEDNEQNIWIATDGGGVNIFVAKNQSFIRIQNQPKNLASLNSNRVYDICQDNVGNLWFGTFIGASRIDKYTTGFELFVQDPNNQNSVRNNFIWHFIEFQSNVLWIGTENGISVFDFVLNKFTLLEEIYPSTRALSSSRIWSMVKDYMGNVWIGTFDSGLYLLDTGSDRLVNFSPSQHEKNSICDKNIHALLEDSLKMLWVGTDNGLNIISTKSHVIKVYKHNPADPNSIPNNIIYHIMEDSENVVWLTTMDGLCRYNREDDNFTTFKNNIGESKNIRHDKFFSVFEDSEQYLWIGSRGSGLYKFDKESKVFTSYTTKDGLPNNVVYGVIEDANGYLWTSTNWGISRFDKRNESFLNFDVTDGLQSNEFNANANIKSKSGEFFFGGMKGFNSFSPSQTKFNKEVPRIVITAFKKFNQEQPGEILNGDTILLTHNDNFFGFEFAALDYTNPSKNRYAFMLENYNEDWTYITADRHFADYTKVTPGKYRFRVIGSNNNNVWNNEGVSLTIIISPPWYRTWYFRIGVLLFIISSIWIFIIFRVRHIKRKHEMEMKVLQIEKQLFDIQQKALRLQMNPHFIFNSLNSIQSYILSNDVDLAVNYLGRFSQLMRLILANSRESVIPLADELKAIRYYLEIEKLRFEEKFSYQIVIDPEIDEEFTGVPPMIIQPYIENAIIHGLIHKPIPGYIKLEFRQIGSKMLCSIEDNGVGRTRAAEIKRQSGLNTKSRGMMMTRERLVFLSKISNEKFSVKVIDLKDKYGGPAGTRVELLITPQDI